MSPPDDKKPAISLANWRTSLAVLAGLTLSVGDQVAAIESQCCINAAHKRAQNLVIMTVSLLPSNSSIRPYEFQRLKSNSICHRARYGTLVVQECPAEEQAETADSHSESGSDNDSSLKCQACESGSLRFMGSTAKPSWSKLLTHFDTRCPSWYAEQDYESFCGQIEREHGIGYEAWCLEMRIESPMKEPAGGRAEPRQPPQQLYLPGLSPEPGFAIESY